MYRSTYRSALQRFYSQHGLVQREGELAQLKSMAKDRTPEPFRKTLAVRRPLVPPSFQGVDNAR